MLWQHRMAIHVDGIWMLWWGWPLFQLQITALSERYIWRDDSGVVVVILVFRDIQIRYNLGAYFCWSLDGSNSFQKRAWFCCESSSRVLAYIGYFLGLLRIFGRKRMLGHEKCNSRTKLFTPLLRRLFVFTFSIFKLQKNSAHNFLVPGTISSSPSWNAYLFCIFKKCWINHLLFNCLKLLGMFTIFAERVLQEHFNT